jgi:hypothetical protein
MDALDHADMGEIKLHQELVYERARRHEETSLAYKNEQAYRRLLGAREFGASRPQRTPQPTSTDDDLVPCPPIRTKDLKEPDDTRAPNIPPHPSPKCGQGEAESADKGKRSSMDETRSSSSASGPGLRDLPPLTRAFSERSLIALPSNPNLPSPALLTRMASSARAREVTKEGLEPIRQQLRKAHSSRTRTVGIALHRLRPINDPTAAMLSILHKLMFIDILPPGIEKDPRRRAIERYKRHIFHLKQNPGSIKKELTRLVDCST